MPARRLSPSAKGDWYVLVGRYDEAFVAALKDVVPSHGREWRSVAGLWRIRPEFHDVVQALIESMPD